MSLRLPGRITVERASASTGLQPIEHEILGEMASALGRAGDAAAKALAVLQDPASGAQVVGSPERDAALRAAARAVHAFFIQRELCGMRRHDDIIREMAIPRAVLVRLGAR